MSCVPSLSNRRSCRVSSSDCVEQSIAPLCPLVPTYFSNEQGVFGGSLLDCSPDTDRDQALSQCSLAVPPEGGSNRNQRPHAPRTKITLQKNRQHPRSSWIDQSTKPLFKHAAKACCVADWQLNRASKSTVVMLKSNLGDSSGHRLAIQKHSESSNASDSKANARPMQAKQLVNRKDILHWFAHDLSAKGAHCPM